MEKLRLTKKDLLEIEEEKERNRQSRLDFIDKYTEWLKKTPNKKWSKQQNKIINKNQLRHETEETFLYSFKQYYFKEKITITKKEYFSLKKAKEENDSLLKGIIESLEDIKQGRVKEWKHN